MTAIPKMSVLSSDKGSIAATFPTQSGAVAFARAQGIPLDHVVEHGRAVALTTRKVRQVNSVASTTGKQGSWSNPDDAEAVSSISLDRQDVENDLLRTIPSFGPEFVADKTVVRRGTRVIDYGLNKLATMHGEHLTLDSKDTLLEHGADIRGEKRQYVNVNWGDLEMVVDDDRLLLVNNDPERMLKDSDGNKTIRRAGLPITPSLMGGLLAYADEFSPTTKGMVTAASAHGLDPDIKAVWFNRTVRRKIQQRIKREEKTMAGGGWLKLGVRIIDGEYEAFSVQSPSHASTKGMDAPALLDLMHSLLPDDVRIEFSYDPNTTKIRCHCWMMRDHTTDMGAGDLYKGGISFGTSDIKGGIWGYIQFLRNLCLNLQIIATEQGNLFSKGHNASVENITEAVTKGTTVGGGVLQDIFATRSILDTTVLADLKPDDEDSVKAVLSAIADIAGLPKRGPRHLAAVADLTEAYHKEPGNTLASGLDAYTRLHESANHDSFDIAMGAQGVFDALAAIAHGKKHKVLVPVLR